MRRHAGHPGILPLVDAHAPEQRDSAEPPWLATPLAVPVRDALGPKPTLTSVVTAVVAIATTLRDLAAQGEHHRDLKPENLFQLDGRWVLGDFGLVTYPGKESLTAPARHVGPVYYLAPELLQDPSAANPEPAAVYALAKILWVLGAHQNYPLQGPFGSAQFALASLVADPRAPILDAFLEAATSYDPAARPSLAESVVELDSWLTQPEPPTTSTLDMTALKAQIRALVGREWDDHGRRQNLLTKAATTANEIKRIAYEFVPILEELVPWSVSATSGGSVVRRAQDLGVPRPELSDGVDIVVAPPWTDSPHFHLFANVQLIRAGRLILAGGYANEVAGVWYRPWSIRREALPGSAAEIAALRDISSGLHENLAPCLKAFAESLGNRADSE